jgi:hypothetical protein
MDTTVVVRTDAIVELVLSGPGDYAYCATMLRRIGTELATRPGFGALIDIRTLDYAPTVEEAHALAELCVRQRAMVGGRVALLVGPGLQDALATVVSLRGAAVEAFTSPVAAITWLRSGPR